MGQKNLIKDLIVLWISVTALVCAALNVYISRHLVETKNISVKGMKK